MNFADRFCMQASLIVLLMLGSAVCTTALAGDAVPKLVQVTGEGLALKARDTPMVTLLAEIARQSGIEIFFQGAPDDVVTIDLPPTSLERGLKRLLRGYSHAVIYAAATEDTVVVRQVHVYDPSGIGAMQALHSSKAPTQAAQKRWHPAEGIVTRPPTPAQADPLVSMAAIDPLMRINSAAAPHLPLGFHEDVSGAAAPALDPLAIPRGGPLPEL